MNINIMNSNQARKRALMGWLLIATLILSPAVGLAKEKDNDDRRDDKREERQENSCLKAFGHLIAPGWIKKNGLTAPSERCLLPFGIAKVFSDRKDNSTTTPRIVDVTAPAINSVTTDVSVRQAIVAWRTDERSDSTVFFSTVSPVDVNASNTLSVSRKERVRTHWLVLKNLNASTTYYGVVQSRDATGNTGRSAQFSFTTEAPEVVTDLRAPAISNVVAVVGTSTARVGWKTDEPATGKIFYSASTTVDMNAGTTLSVENTLLTKEHLLTVAGLAPNTPYSFLIQSKDSAGNTQTTSSFSATTSATTTSGN